MKKEREYTSKYQKELLLKRVAAYVVDLMLCLFFFIIFNYTASLYIHANELKYSFYQMFCLFLVIYIFYIRFPMNNDGQTIGKMLFQICTIYKEKNKYKKMMKVFFREFIIKYIGAIFFIPFSIIHFLFNIWCNKSLNFTLIQDILFHTSTKYACE